MGTSPMNRTTEDLVKLQELDLALRECRLVAGGRNWSGGTELLKRMEKIRGGLAGEILGEFDRMVSRGALAVVEASGQTCLGCHRSLPVAEWHAAMSSAVPVRCPHCQRFIYRME